MRRLPAFEGRVRIPHEHAVMLGWPRQRGAVWTELIGVERFQVQLDGEWKEMWIGDSLLKRGRHE